jgi:hypothetical protein
MNAFAERWVRSIKSEFLSKLILFGEASFRRVVTQFIEHYHLERPHQGEGNERLSLPSPATITKSWHRPMSRRPRRTAPSSINAPHEYFDPTRTASTTPIARIPKSVG